MQMNRKGQAVLAFIAIVVIGFVLYMLIAGNIDFFSMSKLTEKATVVLGSTFNCEHVSPAVLAQKDKDGEDIAGTAIDVVSSKESCMGKKGEDKGVIPESGKPFFVGLSKYLFGMHPGTLTNLGVPNGNIDKLTIRGFIILLMTWVLFFIVFVDMSMMVMGYNSKLNGFLIGLAITLIFTNFGLGYNLLILLMGLYSFLAGLSVMAALVSILLVGVGVHFGWGWATTVLQNKYQLRQIIRGGNVAAAGVNVAQQMGNAAARGARP